MLEKQKCRCGCGGFVEQKICLHCGVVFYPYHSAKGLYCSSSCQGKARKGENNPAWKGGKIERTCKHCGKIFLGFPAELNRERENMLSYCNKKCRASDINKQKINDKTHNLIGNTFNKGKKASETTRRKISIANKGKLAGIKNHFYGKKHTKESIEKIKKHKIDLFTNGFKHLMINLKHFGNDGHVFRSQKEAEICNWFSQHNVQHEIEPIIPFSCKLADFKVGNYYIEVWKDKYCLNIKPRLDKLKHYKQYNIPLIEVFYPCFDPLKILLPEFRE